MKARMILFALIALALVAMPLVNVQAQTGPWYYCSATRTSGGSGTYYDPWACSTEAQIDTVVNTICRLGGGTLYQIFTGFYVIHYVDYSPNGCEVRTDGQHPGYPPNTGPDLPTPLIIGGAASVGLLLVGAGLVLRRKRAVA